MKKIIILVIAFAAVLALVGCSGKKEKSAPSGEVAASGGTTEVYEETGGAHLLFPLVTDLFYYQNEYSPSESDFRLWGWSKDGKVAYSYTFADGGEATAYFTISQFMDNKELFGGAAPCTYDDNDGYWQPSDADTYKNFKNYYCKEHGIEFVQAEYRKLPITHNNITYDVVLEIGKRELNAWDPDFLVVDSYRIFVDMDGKRKLVREAKEEYPTYNVFLLGYFMSPFEKKALLVMGKHIIGGHVFTSFVGVDLDGGFTDVEAEAVSLSFNVSKGVTYHEYMCEGRGDSDIVIASTVPLKDFKFVRFDYRDLGHIGGDELERRVVPLYDVGELRPEKPLLLKNFTVAGPTDTKGITFIDPHGERRNYCIYEDSVGDSGHPYIMVRVD